MQETVGAAACNLFLVSTAVGCCFFFIFKTEIGSVALVVSDEKKMKTFFRSRCLKGYNFVVYEKNVDVMELLYWYRKSVV